jgi:hypothetical protein
MTALTCIGEPISWLRLERHAHEPDASVREHVAACAACRTCLDEIERDVVALPPLPAPPARRRPWWHVALPIGGALAAAALILLVLRPREVDPMTDTTRIKGLGTVVLDVVRERSGVVRGDVRTFATGDRWKLVLTCSLSDTARVEIDVREENTAHTDHPLAPVEIVCGNRVTLPGAFTVSGAAHQVCARIAGPGGTGTTCVTLRPE